MRTHPPLASLIVLLGLLLPPIAHAQGGDEELFSASGGARPNLLLLLDSSGSMGKEPSNNEACTGDCRKRDLANMAIRDLVTAVNPLNEDGSNDVNARLGFAIFTKDGARLLVPVGEQTTQSIVDWVTLPDIPTAADEINSLGGNSHGYAIMDAARYFAHHPTHSPTSTFGPFPPWGFGDSAYSGDLYPDAFPDVDGGASEGDFPFEDPTLPSVWDLACRPTFLIHIDDGLWGGAGGGKYGECVDLDGDGDDGACTEEFIGDISGDGDFWMEDITKKMHEYDFAPHLNGTQFVTTHVIGFDEPQAVALMKTTAELGGGTFQFASSGEELTEALFNITINIFDSVASFAGIAIPASRTAGGSYLYNAFFEPGSGQTIWAGHLESYRLAPDGEILDKDGAAALDPDTGLLLDPHNPYWDAGEELRTNTSRVVWSTKSGQRVPFDKSNTDPATMITIADLALQSGPPGPPPPPGPCDPVDPIIPDRWHFEIIKLDGVAVSGPPYEIKPDKKIKLRYCVPPNRKNIDKDFFGSFPVDGDTTDGIELFTRKKGDATCKYEDSADPNKPTGGWKDKDIKSGKVEQLIHLRYYAVDAVPGEDPLAQSLSICVKPDAGGTPPPPPPPPPDFALFPNATTSGIDTYDELRDAVMDFALGKDAFDQDDDADFTDMRDTVLGDIFHSTPLVVGLPTSALLAEDGFASFRSSYVARDQVIYAGANDGMLHAFDAGQFQSGDDPGTPETENGYYTPGTGAELFGYVPGLLLDRIKMLSRNSPRTTYFVDGSPVAADAWLGDGSSSDTTKSADEWATVLITGLRDGGPGYIALDVTDPGASSGPHGPYPKLLWEFTHAKLGEARSEAIITRLKVRASSGTGDKCGKDDGDGDCREQWVAIFGGGYEASGDPNGFAFAGDPSDPNWTDRSKAIFIVNLATGDLLASVEYDQTGLNGPYEMLYSLPGTPGVLDLDFDGFADVLYIGDLGGQLWKWDLSQVGEDSNFDAVIDNWPAGIFFATSPEDMGGGVFRYRSIFSSPAATFAHGKLTLAFGTGEREDLKYAGDESRDENNRFYVVHDLVPTGSGAFSSLTTESDLTDITLSEKDTDQGDAGFFFVAEDAEKFVTDVTIFAGQVLVASYSPEAGTDECITGGGQAFLYTFAIESGAGFYPAESTPYMDQRRVIIGGGLPSNPTVSLGDDPDDDVVFIKTSTGQIIELDPPDRDNDEVTIIYWREVF